MHAVLIAVWPATALASTLTVDGAGGADHLTIQAAIDAASSGDDISVADGAYGECLDTAGKDLDISGAGVDLVVIDGLGACTSAMVIDNGETVSMSGLTFQNSGGRGVLVQDSLFTLSDAAIVDSGASDLDGGGLSVSGSVLILTRVTLSGNTGATGGALYAEDVVRIDTDAFCELIAGFGVSCDDCDSDGQPYCLGVAIDQIPADGGRVNLQEISAADVNNNGDCG